MDLEPVLDHTTADIERVDTPELVQPTERDRAAIEQERKERQRAYDKAWRAKHIDKIKARKKEYYAAKRDEIKAQQKEYKAAKRDEIKAQQKEYYAAKRDDVLVQQQEYYAVKREERKERQRAYDKAWRVKYIDKIKARKKEYCAAKRDEIKAKKKEYRAKHRDELKARRKEYYAAKRDDVLVQQKEYYAAKRDDVLARQQEYRRTKLGCVYCKEWPVDWRQGWPHYDGYCWRCFSDKFKDDERVKTRGRVELRVRSYLDSHFKEFVHDQPIHTAHCVCSHRRRIDHRRLIGNTILCVETDENFHKYYDPDDEEARYHDVVMQWGGKLCFVRFNPHKFNLDDRYDHGPPLAERLERLYAEITRHVGRLERGENSAFLEVWHLYYPEGTEDYCGEAIAPEGL
jgi:hypothetical protein